MNKYHGMAYGLMPQDLYLFDAEVINGINSSETKIIYGNGILENPFSNDIDGFGRLYLTKFSYRR